MITHVPKSALERAIRTAIKHMGKAWGDEEILDAFVGHIVRKTELSVSLDKKGIDLSSGDIHGYAEAVDSRYEFWVKSDSEILVEYA